MKNNLIFITGTDTGIGKTVATAALINHYIKKNINVGVIKAIQSGEISDIDFIIKNTFKSFCRIGFVVLHRPKNYPK